MNGEPLNPQHFIQAMLQRGWQWSESDLLVHPADHDLAVRVSGATGELTLSPKLESHLNLVIPTPASKGRFRR